MPDVFISHAREDSELVRCLSAALVSANREPWVDREEIMPADRWLESIHEGIDTTDSFVVVVSPDSVSPRTNAEPFWATPTQSTTSRARQSRVHH